MKLEEGNEDDEKRERENEAGRKEMKMTRREKERA